MARAPASACLLLAVCLVAVTGAFAAEVPWRLVANPIRAALAEDGNVTTKVTVSATQVSLAITVSAKATRQKAQTLCTLLTAATNLKNKNLTQKVVITVKHGTVAIKAGSPPGQAVGASAMLDSALRGNPLFFNTYLSPEISGYTALFSPRVAQYFTGTQFQRDGLETVTIAQLMDSVFNLRSYKVFASTAQCYGKGCVAPIFT